MALGTLLLMVGLAYGLGILWYSILQAKVPDKIWRITAYPFVGIYVAESLLGKGNTWDASFGDIHLVTAIIGSIVAVVVDMVIASVRKPAEVA